MCIYLLTYLPWCLLQEFTVVYLMNVEWRQMVADTQNNRTDFGHDSACMLLSSKPTSAQKPTLILRSNESSILHQLTPVLRDTILPF